MRFPTLTSPVAAEHWRPAQDNHGSNAAAAATVAAPATFLPDFAETLPYEAVRKADGTALHGVSG